MNDSPRLLLTSSVIALTLVATYLTGDVSAQPTWKATGGPLGGEVLAVIETPGGNILAAMRYGGVFRSSDLGDSWSRTAITHGSDYINDFAVDTLGVLFAAGTEGVTRSTDDGETWDLLTEGLDAGVFTRLGVGANNNLYAGADGSGMYKSTDGGTTWTQINEGLGGLRITAIAASGDSLVYAGTRDGLFMSDDAGGSWTDVSEGLEHRSVQSVFIDGDGVVWASASSLYKRNDTPEGWEDTGQRATYAFDTTATGRYLGGACEVFMTSDDGINWDQQAIEPRPFVCINDLAVTDTTIIAGSSRRGVYRSTDDAESWMLVNEGLNASSVDAFLATAGALITGSDQGIHRSTDGGTTWTRHIDGLTRVNIRSLLSATDGSVWAGTSFSGHALFRSMDDGVTWAEGDSTYPGRTYALAQAPNGDIFVGGFGVIYRGVGGEAPFDTVDSGFGTRSVTALRVSSSGEIYAGSFENVRRSTDGGDSWEYLENGLPVNPGVVDFEFLQNGDVVAALYSSVYRLTEGDSTWVETTRPPAAGLRDLLVDSSGNLYVASQGGVAVSFDGGDGWLEISTGLNPVSTTSLVVTTDAAKGGVGATDVLYAGTRGGGVSVLTPGSTAAESENPGEVASARLEPNYPNPFTDATVIPLTLDETSSVSVTLFDILGRRTHRRDLGRLNAGRHQIRLDANGLSPGTYLAVVETDGLVLRQVVTLAASSAGQRSK